MVNCPVAAPVTRPSNTTSPVPSRSARAPSSSAASATRLGNPTSPVPTRSTATPSVETPSVAYRKKEEACRMHSSKEGCQKGARCRFSHASSAPVGVCHQYGRKGRCDWGDSCHYAHERQHSPTPTSSVARAPPTVPVPVQGIRSSSAPLGVCRHYGRTGHCRYGNDCHYEHVRERSPAPTPLVPGGPPVAAAPTPTANRGPPLGSADPGRRDRGG
jgi:hypothetical protein